MDAAAVVTLLGGIGMFLLGIHHLTEGLKGLSGDSLRRILQKVVSGRFSAVVSGALLTVATQSSTATILTVIGFVGAGLVTLPQAIAVNIGATVGTTSTPWMVAFFGLRLRIATMALPILGVGAFLWLIARGKTRSLGAVLAGFGLIFTGIDFLQTGMAGIKWNLEAWAGTGFGAMWILFGIGLVMTVVMQSSSAAVATTLVALDAGSLTFEQGCAMVVGQSVGTAATTALAVIGGSLVVRRAALAHIVYSLITGVLAMLFLTPLTSTAGWVGARLDDPKGVLALAAFSSIFKLAGVVAFYPWLDAFARFVTRISGAGTTSAVGRLEPTVARAGGAVALEASWRAILEVAHGAVDAVRRRLAGEPVTYQPGDAIRQIESFLESLSLETTDLGTMGPRLVRVAHALDHLSELEDDLASIPPVAGDWQAPVGFEASSRALAAWLDATRDPEAQPEPAVFKALEEASKQHSAERKTGREQILEELALRRIPAAAARAGLDTLNWANGAVYHAWRLAESLRIASGIEEGTMNTATITSTAWHALAADDVVERLGTDTEKGLDAAEITQRLAKYGPNRLPEGKKQGPLMRFLLQFNNVLVYVLLAAGFVKLMMSLWLDAAIILGVVLLNALLGFIQEGKAEKALDSIRNMLSAEARTVRGRETRMVPAEELVPGDIVLLESGDKVPADLRLTDVKNLRTEEAALTGESVPADKSTATVSAKATVGDRDNMAFSGTLVVSGRATGVVVGTGSDTELGRINQMLESVSALETPLLRQIKKFGFTITVVILAVAALVFAYGHWVKDMPFVNIFQAVVAIAVSFIPEGLPAVITITLAIGVQRMAQRHAIIRRLPAVETLGSVSRICSDKTGTLTLMEMMVVSAITAESAYEITGEGYAGEGEIKQNGQPAGKDSVLQLLGRVSVLCNDAELRREEGVWKVEGDPTEGALYPFAGKVGLQRPAEQAAYARIDAIPFESEHKFMATLHTAAGGGKVLFVKGAPEVILDHCDRQQTRDGGHVPLNRDHFLKASDRLAGQGERVLALAWLENPAVSVGNLGPGDLPRNLVLLGLIGLLDPPRKEAIEAVKECHNGGIRVTMITGDHRITAAAIAKMLGIGDGKTAVTGAEIQEMDTATLLERCRDVDVFARASPEHKLRLVKAMQASKQIVAMTGDGVNDAPALKKADIGVAMGIKGTEVTKEAADMVLADDNFASITAAVREGRTVYNNIEKAILFMLPTNVAQGLVIMVAIFAGFTIPITAPQILWVNMVTSVALALVLSFEPHELDVMRRPPRAVDRPILTPFGVWRILFVGAALVAYTLAAFFWMKSLDASDALARTVAVNAITLGQVFYLLNSRYRIDSSLSLKAHLGNSYLALGIGAVVVLQLLFTYAPPLQALFNTESVPLRIWPWLVLGGFLFFIMVEAEKLVLRSVRSAQSAPAMSDTSN